MNGIILFTLNLLTASYAYLPVFYFLDGSFLHLENLLMNKQDWFDLFFQVEMSFFYIKQKSAESFGGLRLN